MKSFNLPDLGEGVHEGRIVRVMVSVGDVIREDQPLLEVETDKAAVVIPSPLEGRVQAVHVTEGQLVRVGDVMVSVGDAGERPAGKAQRDAPARQGVVASGAGTRSGHAARQSSAPSSQGHDRASHGVSAGAARPTPASPAVRQLARRLGVELAEVSGSGPGGRVQRADVEHAVAEAQVRPSGNAGRAMPPMQASAPFTRIAPPLGRPSAPPVVAGRVHHAALPESSVVEPPGETANDSHGPIKRAPLSQARKTIATVMSQSWSAIPHATDADDADVTQLEALCTGYSPLEGGARKLTLLAFVVRAAARALQRFPEFNAHYDADRSEVVYKRYISIAIGVHTERGLVPLVLRNTDQLTIPQISEALSVMSEKARAASFAVNDTRGGTYTISNAGAMGGSRYSTPIITPGQAAVLAIGRTRWMPWVVEQENGSRGLAPRLIMPLSHSIDHRLLDGGQEVEFMQHIIGDLQNPARLLL